MTWQRIAPVSKASKDLRILKYEHSQKRDTGQYERGKKEKEKQGEFEKTFTAAFLAKETKKSEATSDMREKSGSTRPYPNTMGYSPYMRAKILAGTLAFELTRIDMTDDMEI